MIGLIVLISVTLLVLGCAQPVPPKTEPAKTTAPTPTVKDAQVQTTEGAAQATEEKDFGKNVPDAPNTRDVNLPSAPTLT